MKSDWNIGKLRKGRLVRAVALLFLFHTAVDLVFPQFCSEEPVNLAINHSSPVSKEASLHETPATVGASLPNDSDRQPSDTPPRDEDCFCCCTHVMASHGFVDPDNAELKLPTGAQPDISILSAPPNNPYHPPRIA